MVTQEQDNKDHARRFNEEVWREFNVDAIDELVAEDYVGHNPALPEPVRGPDGIREVAKLLHAAFLDCDVELDAVVADGDWLAQRVTLSATHEGEFIGVEPSGTNVEIPNMLFTGIEDGMIAKRWLLPDTLGLMQQFGIIEQPTE